ncbi:MAG: Si-specific NAD(P)(+) transhydrogenase [Candidatus Dadabacteria bacterium]|nr:MAG: Si-specific NAD(P)(+) transhydrogenase [Candidatus Dadabacteria bacterium]
MSRYEYDLVVIGSGPGGQRAAIQAGKLGKRVLLVDLNPQVGGVCLHDGTIPSKSFREAILHLTGYRLRERYGKAYRIKHKIVMEDLLAWSEGIVHEIEQTLRSQLLRNNVEIMCGHGMLLNEHSVKILHRNMEETVTAEFIVLATGTRPRHPEGFDFDNEVVLDSNGILYMDHLPQTLTIVGGGVIGSEYGSMFATLGLKVTIVEARDEILGFVDQEMIDALSFYLRQQRATILTKEKVIRCTKSKDGRAITYLESGKRIVSDVLLVSAGRVGNTDNLGLENVGLKADQRGLLKVNEHYQTDVPNIYAVGDIIGHPALASTAMEQGRSAMLHAFNIDEEHGDGIFPFGIFTIPEIAMVGKTEQQLSEEKVPYDTGICRFEELERGRILGATRGMLKIIFERHTRKLLGVHIMGEGAVELIHIGQCVMSSGGKLDDLVHMIFNYPALSQAYKIAALDGMNKVIAVRDLPSDEEILNGAEKG